MDQDHGLRWLLSMTEYNLMQILDLVILNYGWFNI